MQNASIRSSKLTVDKNRRHILDSLDFTIQSGTVTGLIGPSGSGKTTLMRAIVGVQIPTNGELTVLDQAAGSAVLRKKIGYVTQVPAIYEDLTVWQNIDYFTRITGASVAQAEQIIKRVQLTPQRNQLASTLSGGQKARVSLAIALLGDPQVLVLDEPTVGLDPLLRQDLWNLFDELAHEEKTLVISSHVMDEADRCASLLLLREGKLLWHGQKDALLQQTASTSVGEAFMAMVTQKETH